MSLILRAAELLSLPDEEAHAHRHTPPEIASKPVALSLPAIAAAARAWYPVAAAKLKELPLEELSQQPRAVRIALQVRDSLLVQLLSSVPLRLSAVTQLGYRPSQLEAGRNLRKVGGEWYLQETQIELMIRRPPLPCWLLPTELAAGLEEYLQVWRPVLLAQQADNRQGAEKVAPFSKEEYVLLSAQGLPLRSQQAQTQLRRIMPAILGRGLHSSQIFAQWRAAEKAGRQQQ